MLCMLHMDCQMCTYQAKTSPERRQEGETSTPSTEMSSPSLPSLPSQPEEVGGSCDCGSIDPVTKSSAWERTSSSILKGEDDSGHTNNTSVRASRVSVSPAETLDLRIFCGTWNVAGMRVLLAVLAFVPFAM